MRRRSQPVTREITWSPGEDGDAFRATARLDGEEQWIVAQSRRFARDSPDPPAYDAASHAAYERAAARPLRRRLAALRARPRVVGRAPAPPPRTPS
jgi:hypothetical protein